MIGEGEMKAERGGEEKRKDGALYLIPGSMHTLPTSDFKL